MAYAQTIALARSLLREGRAGDALRMLRPLTSDLEPTPETAALLTLEAQLRLLYEGAVGAALRRLEALRAIRLPATLHQEVLLWWAWAHAWPEHEASDPALALHFFEELDEQLSERARPETAAWLALGRARAYASLDEYALVTETLPSALPVGRFHRYIRRWEDALRLPALLYEGRTAEAEEALDRLERMGRHLHDTLALAEALLFRSWKAWLEGAAPSAWQPLLEEAEQHLQLLPEPPAHGVTLWYRLQGEALLRGGHGTALERHLARWAEEATPPASRLQQQMMAARRDLRQGRVEEALTRLQAMEKDWPEPSGYRLRIEHALLMSQGYRELGDLARAHDYACQACRRAREIGSPYHVHHARLQEALTHGEASVVADLLHKVQRDLTLHGYLPLAYDRYLARAYLAELQDRPAQGIELLEQAVAVASLMGDPWRTARTEIDLASRLAGQAPGRARRLLQRAEARLRALGTDHPRLHELRRFLDEQVPVEAGEVTIGRSLFRAAISEPLVAEVWLHALEDLLPDHWMGLFVHEAPDRWRLLRMHGEEPPAFRLPDPPPEAEITLEGIRWLPLPSHGPHRTYLLGVALRPETPWEDVRGRIQPWLPVLALALDYAAHHRGIHRVEEVQPVDEADWVYASHRMDRLTRQAHRLARTHSPVLIEGPAGSGKKHLAGLIHRLSRRREGPLVFFQMEEGLPDSLRWKHLQQALEKARGGTLVIDHVERWPRTLQRNLVRRMDGGWSLDVRLMATLEEGHEMHLDDALRARLGTLHLRLPPLRERVEDIPALTYHFLRVLHPTGAPIVGITEEALEAFMRYPWPGNVRQLRQEIERVLLPMASEPMAIVHLDDLPPDLRAHARKAPEMPPVTETLEERVARFEREIIEETLAAVEGNVSAAARRLGLTRQGLYKKMQRLKIQVPSVTM